MATGHSMWKTVRLRSQIVTLEIVAERASGLRSQIVTAKVVEVKAIAFFKITVCDLKELAAIVLPKLEVTVCDLKFSIWF